MSRTSLRSVRGLVLALTLTAVASLGLAAASCGPEPAFALDKSVVYAAGDSVRFVIRATPPAVDSIVVQWALGPQAIRHSRVAPLPNPVADTAKFAMSPQSPGGSNYTGNVTVTTWKAGVSSPGVSKVFDVKRPPPSAPADVGGLVFLDSAVVY